MISSLICTSVGNLETSQRAGLFRLPLGSARSREPQARREGDDGVRLLSLEDGKCAMI